MSHFSFLENIRVQQIEQRPYDHIAGMLDALMMAEMSISSDPNKRRTSEWSLPLLSPRGSRRSAARFAKFVETFLRNGAEVVPEIYGIDYLLPPFALSFQREIGVVYMTSVYEIYTHFPNHLQWRCVQQ